MLQGLSIALPTAAPPPADDDEDDVDFVEHVLDAMKRPELQPFLGERQPATGEDVLSRLKAYGFQLGAPIAQGASAVVYEIKSRSFDSFAIRIEKTDTGAHMHLHQTLAELDISPRLVATFRVGRYICSIMQKFDTDAERYMDDTNSRELPVLVQLSVIVLLLGVAEAGYVLLDLKPANVVINVDSEGHAKTVRLIDFDNVAACSADLDIGTRYAAMLFAFYLFNLRTWRARAVAFVLKRLRELLAEGGAEMVAGVHMVVRDNEFGALARQYADMSPSEAAAALDSIVAV